MSRLQSIAASLPGGSGSKPAKTMSGLGAARTTTNTKIRTKYERTQKVIQSQHAGGDAGQWNAAFLGCQRTRNMPGTIQRERGCGKSGYLRRASHLLLRPKLRAVLVLWYRRQLRHRTICLRPFSVRQLLPLSHGSEVPALKAHRASLQRSQAFQRNREILPGISRSRPDRRLGFVAHAIDAAGPK